MTGRTHDLSAFTALVLVFVLLPSLPPMSLATAIAAFGANFIGGLFPDIDQKTSDVWDNFRLGPFVAKVICPFLGGHRNLSHSLVGVVLIGGLSHLLLQAVKSVVLLDVDMQIVWWSFMIGVVSHILMDMPTKAGVPFFWPLDYNVGIPPIRALRIESGKFVENWLIFPGLILLNIYVFYINQTRVLEFLKHYIN